ncbi:LOW QUALITY PROTEIN: afadin [Hippocampus comes]|uniref:LOW QUALITY PROTEIN: afadin n=1 Tax=Hippocampus comes TaxID=109280 RepID=UPI00094E4348|nr:PREDICTED: LOW QUALITY PROTEIN: afadin-like [Hippocampus comes]
MPTEEEREKLAHVIRRWNNNRLDLFEISEPDTNLVFQGVMRFYFEDRAGGNVATKCLRFCSDASTTEVVETLAEKFRPDMKMLSTCHSLYEIHGNKERQLDPDERPLVVQLNWNSDNREGRFVLKQSKETPGESGHNKEKGGVIQTFKRTLSRKDKKNRNKGADEPAGDENRASENPANGNPETPGRCTGAKRQGEWQADTSGPQPDSFDQLGLPLGIQLCDHSEEAFLTAVINYSNSSTIHFKLSPAYALYAAGRFALRRPDAATGGVSSIVDKMVAVTSKVIQASPEAYSCHVSLPSVRGRGGDANEEWGGTPQRQHILFIFQRQQDIAGALAFWLANTSELLNFFKHDKDLSGLTRQSQLDLSHLVHKAYSHLIQCIQIELSKNLPTFLIDPEQHGPLPAGTEMVLNTLMNSMSLLRRYQVNPALAIQLFSQLFHFISTWLFNRLVNPDTSTPGLRSHYWGAALRQRLTGIEAWAERQGLELAADCHLGRVIQATMLLTMNKYTTEDVKEIQNSCFKLNSLQLQALLSGYFYAPNEPHIPAELITAAVMAAEASADNLIRQEGRDVQLEENLDLHLPFLLPDGGYSCDSMRGTPPGFREFLEPICQRGLCYLTSQQNPKGDWTVFFNEPGTPYLDNQKEPQTVTITLKKPLNSGMGVSIVAAKGAGQDHLGIYIKSIVKGGPAEMNGLLTAGDQLLSVDGQNLLGLSQERAAAIMMQTGPILTLKVAKFGASFNGLGALLGDPAPPKTAAGDNSHVAASRKEIPLYAVEELAQPEQSGFRHGRRGEKKAQIMQRNRQFYRSNPNMADFALEDGDELANRDVRGNKSLSNLSTDTFHREYLTLPTPKYQDKNTSASGRPQQMFQVSLRPLGGPNAVHKRSLMRQAVSQENLCVDTGGPLLDTSQIIWQGRGAKQNYHSHLPVRPSVSNQNLLVDNCCPDKGQQGSRAGIWRTPFSQQPTPTPSIQPVRIDIPVTRPLASHANPPLTTFQHRSRLVALRSGSTLQINGHSDQRSPKPPVNYYACPIPADQKLPRPSRLSQQHAAKPQVSITPTKHVSFQEPLSQQKHGACPAEPKDFREPNETPKPREDELLEQEVKALQAKEELGAKETERLGRLSLEWQFQKRLREIQQRGEDEDEDDDDLDMMVMIRELEKRAQKTKSPTEKATNDDLKAETKSLAVPKDEKTGTLLVEY